MNTSATMQIVKKVAIVAGFAVAIFASYSVAGYVSDTLVGAGAATADCGSCQVHWIDGPGQIFNEPFAYTGSTIEMGGGGYVPQTPACVLTVAADYGVYQLGWTTVNATTISIDQGIGSVTPVAYGSVSVNPSSTKTYTATVTNGAQTATCSTTITVTPPPTPPICTLDLTKDKITWTTNYAYQVLIKPLTNSPEIPGNVNPGPSTSVQHTETQAYTSTAVIQSLAANGINLPAVQGYTGFAGDYTTMNKVCALIDGAGSSALTFTSEGYSSPSNNMIVRWNGSSWSHVSATTFNNHLRYGFTCSKAGSLGGYPLNGSYTFVPPLGYGTHTYQLTATGAGGTVQCEDTITIEPPKECKLEITKKANKTTAAPGESIEYTIEFKNVGNKNCTGSGVKVTDTLDALLTYESETHSSNITPGYLSDPVYKSSDRTVRFNAWDLEPGESGWFKIKVKAGTPTSCSTVVGNYAQISSYEYSNFQSWVSTQPVVNVTIEKDCTPPPVTECKMIIDKSVNKTSVNAEEEVEYTITFKNIGNKNCTGGGVKVMDVIDLGLTYKSETHSTNVSGGYGGDPVYKSYDRT
ncbi:MAG: hypothetical protein AAB955_01895, partial [Patescibacteria group bacterium]